LRYPRAPSDHKGLASKIDKNDADLSTIICVDRPRAVQNGHSIMQSQSRSGTDLRFKTLGQLKRQPGWNQRPIAGSEDDLAIDRQRGHEVHPGRIFTPKLLQLQALGVRQPAVSNRNH
jgi:hypothetical protein